MTNSDKRISFVNGEFLNHDKAFVHIDDRGFQFGDGVYEVILFFKNKIIDAKPHLARLERSLKEIDLEFLSPTSEIEKLILELFSRNNLQDGYVYLQITRGATPRTQGLIKGLKPNLVMTVSPLKIPVEKHLHSIISSSKAVLENELSSYKVITHEDLRWHRCDIKSLNLLAANMIRQKAMEQNAVEAVMIRDGLITEGSFSNVFIVDKNDILITRAPDNFILQGITRDRIIDLAKQNNIKVEEKKFSQDELLNAKEIFLTSSTLLIRPILQVNEKIIDGREIGKITKLLATKYQNFLL